jgi:hypothetical protein
MSAVSGAITPETADKGIGSLAGKSRGRTGSLRMPGQTRPAGHLSVMSALRARHAENSCYSGTLTIRRCPSTSVGARQLVGIHRPQA